MTTVRSKLEKLCFSGKEEDFCFFADQFEARMYVLRLDKVLLDKVVITQADTTDATAVTQQEKDESDLLDQRYQVWCELIQCLQREAGMLLRAHKGDGTKAWKVLNDRYKSSERPRIQQLLQSLTNHKLEAGESVSSYLIRAEDLRLNLTEVGETVSEQMMCSIVLKGLPKDYESFVTVVNYGGTVKDFDTLKRDLLNFSSDRKKESSSSAFLSDESGMKCYQCNKLGHRKVNCPQRKVSGLCHTCKKPGHYARDCKQKREACTNCGKVGHVLARCFAEGGGAHKASSHLSSVVQSDEASGGFCFMSSDNQSSCRESDILIDSGCTGYMLKDKHLFTSLNMGSHGL